MYKKKESSKSGQAYTLLGEYATMEEVLESGCIGGTKFSEIIIDPDTELTGQD